jgi:hypothetical protein
MENRDEHNGCAEQGPSFERRAKKLKSAKLTVAGIGRRPLPGAAGERILTGDRAT